MHRTCVSLIILISSFYLAFTMVSGEDGEGDARQGIQFEIQDVKLVGRTFVVDLSYDATGTIKWHTGQDVEVDRLQVAWVKAYFFDDGDSRAFDIYNWIGMTSKFFPKPPGADTTIGTAIHHSGVVVHDVDALGILHMFTDMSPLSGSVEIVLDYAAYVEVGHAYDVLLIASLDFNGHGAWDASAYRNGGNYDSIRPIDLEIRYPLSLVLEGPDSITFVRGNHRVLFSQRRPFAVEAERYYALGDATLEDSIYFEVKATDLGQRNMEEVGYLWTLGTKTASGEWIPWDIIASKSREFYLRDDTLSTQSYLDALVHDVAPHSTLSAYLSVEAYSSYEEVGSVLAVRGEKIGESNAKEFKVKGLDLRIVGPDKISPQDQGATFRLEGAELDTIRLEELNWTIYLESPDRYADWLIIQDKIDDASTREAELLRGRSDLDYWADRIIWLTFTNPRIAMTPSEADLKLTVSIRTKDGEWPWLLAKPVRFVVASSLLPSLLALSVMGLKAFVRR